MTRDKNRRSRCMGSTSWKYLQCHLCLNQCIGPGYVLLVSGFGHVGTGLAKDVHRDNVHACTMSSFLVEDSCFGGRGVGPRS